MNDGFVSQIQLCNTFNKEMRKQKVKMKLGLDYINKTRTGHMNKRRNTKRSQNQRHDRRPKKQVPKPY